MYNQSSSYHWRIYSFFFGYDLTRMTTEIFLIVYVLVLHDTWVMIQDETKLRYLSNTSEYFRENG